MYNINTSVSQLYTNMTLTELLTVNELNNDTLLIHQTIYHDQPTTRLPDNTLQKLSHKGKCSWIKPGGKIKSTILHSLVKNNSHNTLVHN